MQMNFFLFYTLTRTNGNRTPNLTLKMSEAVCHWATRLLAAKWYLILCFTTSTHIICIMMVIPLYRYMVYINISNYKIKYHFITENSDGNLTCSSMLGNKWCKVQTSNKNRESKLNNCTPVKIFKSSAALFKQSLIHWQTNLRHIPHMSTTCNPLYFHHYPIITKTLLGTLPHIDLYTLFSLNHTKIIH